MGFIGSFTGMIGSPSLANKEHKPSGHSFPIRAGVGV